MDYHRVMMSTFWRTAVGVGVGIAFFTVGYVYVSPVYVTLTQDIESLQTIMVDNDALQGTMNDYFVQNAFLHTQVISIVQSMTNEQLAGQVLMSAWEKNASLDDMIVTIKQYHLGGVMVLHNDATPDMVIQLQKSATQTVGNTVVPSFVSIDAEPSLLQHRIPSAGYTTQTSQLQTQQQSYQAGLEIADIISGYGYNVNFAPVYDSGINREIIADRAFGTDPKTIELLAGSFSQSLMDRGIVAVAKHFPGHGYAVGDTHKELLSIPGTLPERSVFQSAIDSHVPMIMVGHLVTDGGTYDSDGLPATLSATSSSLLLRQDMGFQGVIITDAMVMGALDAFDDVDMRSLESGVDIILMPRSLNKTYNHLVSQMATDSTYREMIQEKVYRIVRLKLVQQWAR